jgi:hypothetical protein
VGVAAEMVLAKAAPTSATATDAQAPRTLLPATATALFGRVVSGVMAAGIGAHLGGVSQSASAGAGRQRLRDGSGVAENFMRTGTICP